MTHLLKKLSLASIVLFLGLALSACRGGAPVQEYETQSVPSNVKSAEQVKQSIKLAGNSLGWIISEDGNGKLKGILNARKHQAVVSINYSAKDYSIRYLSSVELGYDAEAKTIHKNYNGWLQNLNNRIQFQLTTQ